MLIFVCVAATISARSTDEFKSTATESSLETPATVAEYTKPATGEKYNKRKARQAEAHLESLAALNEVTKKGMDAINAVTMESAVEAEGMTDARIQMMKSTTTKNDATASKCDAQALQTRIETMRGVIESDSFKYNTPSRQAELRRKYDDLVDASFA